MASTLLLSVEEGGISFGEKTLFEDLTFHIHDGNKICLVGKNGTGKTTLMRIVTGEAHLDAGERWQLPGTHIGYLQQDVAIIPGQTVYDFVFETVKADTEEEKQLNAYKVDAILTPLELEPQRTMDLLSGGQVRRAALARALVENPDILLLDEPTNHLDLHIIEWLENYLKSYRGALVCVSHDRAFLETISDRVFWLDRGRIKICPKGFSHFEEWSEMLLEQEARELKNREKTVGLEVEWASRGVKARRKRNQRRLEMMREARDKLLQDKSAYRRMMAKIELDPLEYEVSSKIVAEFIKVRKTFVREGAADLPILEGFSLRIQRGDRIGILGKNGSGKTTFLRMLVDEIEPDAGKVKRAKELTFSYFDQKRKDLKPEATVKDILCPQGGDYLKVMGKTRHVCGYLKDFLFDPSQVDQRVGTLSGGQKNRLLLAKILANPGSFLILDEPTNDLDMDTLDHLSEILAAYQGTLIIVSHDRDFLDQTVTKILAFEGNAKIDGYIGGYSDYIQAKKQQGGGEFSDDGEIITPSKPSRKENKPAVPVVTAPSVATTPNRMSYKYVHELEKLPGKIAALEKDVAAFEEAMADPSLYMRDPELFDRTARKLGNARADLEKLETRWLELEDMKAQAG